MIFLMTVDRMRLQRDCEHLHSLGPRALAEFLAEIAARTDTLPTILERLSAYRQGLTPEMLRATGGDRFSPRPLRVVPR